VGGQFYEINRFAVLEGFSFFTAKGVKGLRKGRDLRQKKRCFTTCFIFSFDMLLFLPEKGLSLHQKF